MENHRIFGKALLSLIVVAASIGCSGTSSKSMSAEEAQLQAVMLASAGPDIGGSSLSGAIPTFQPRPARPENEVAPGNTIHLACNEDPKIAGDFRVEFDGQLKLPYEVKVQAGGLTVEQLSATIRQQFSAFFRSPPAIQVSITDRKLLVRAQGLVDKPGEYLVAPQGSLDEVIAQAGGLQKASDQHAIARYARIVDGGYRAALKLADYYTGAPTSAPIWHGGETVFFQNEGQGIGDFIGVNKNYVQVMGQVRTPGEFLFRENANFFYYLVQAGGPTDRANTNNIVVMRAEGPKLKAIPFSVNEPEDIPGIKGGDVVLVQADNPSNLEKDTSVFGNIGGFISSMAATVLIATGL